MRHHVNVNFWPRKATSWWTKSKWQISTSPLCLFTSLNKGFKLWVFRPLDVPQSTKKNTPGFPCFRCRRWWCLEFSRIGTRTPVTWHEMGETTRHWVGVALFYLVYLGVPTKQYSHFIGGYKLTTPRNNANLVKLARDRKHDVFWPPNFGSF